MTNPASSPAKPAASITDLSELPIIEGTIAPVQVGVFAPSVLNMPSPSEIVAILSLFSLNTPPIAGQDAQGNLVNAQGNLVIPAKLRPFFQIVAVAPQS